MYLEKICIKFFQNTYIFVPFSNGLDKHEDEKNTGIFVLFKETKSINKAR